MFCRFALIIPLGLACFTFLPQARAVCDAVNAMLLNEFLKEHETVQELKKQVAELTAGLQRVSAQLEIMKPILQTESR